MQPFCLGPAWRYDLHGNVMLLEKLLEGTAELGAVVGLALPDDDREGLEDALEGRPHVARRRGVTSSAVVSFEIGSLTIR